MQKIITIVQFLGKDMTDAQAERIGDMARNLVEYDVYKLEEITDGTLYTILRQICAEKGWMQ